MCARMGWERKVHVQFGNPISRVPVLRHQIGCICEVSLRGILTGEFRLSNIQTFSAVLQNLILINIISILYHVIGCRHVLIFLVCSIVGKSFRNSPCSQLMVDRLPELLSI